MQSSNKFIIIRNNNIKELKNTLNKQNNQINIYIQYTILYILTQNNVAEQYIQITENNIYILIKEVDLLLKF